MVEEKQHLLWKDIIRKDKKFKLHLKEEEMKRKTDLSNVIEIPETYPSDTLHLERLQCKRCEKLLPREKTSNHLEHKTKCQAKSIELRNIRKAIESKEQVTDEQMLQDEDESDIDDFEMKEQDGEKERKNNATVQELYYTDEWEKLHGNSSSTSHNIFECHTISRELRNIREAIESKKKVTGKQMEQDDEEESDKQDFEMKEQDGEKERKNNAVVQELYYTDEWEKLHDNSSSTPHTNLECHAISRELRKEERTDKGEAIESKKKFTDNQMEQDDEDESEKQDFEMEEQDGEKERKNNAVVQELYYTDEWEKLHDNSSSTPHTNLECHAISRELRKEERTDKGEAIESKKKFTDNQMEQDDEDESEKQDFEMEEQDGEKERKNNAVVQELYYTDEWEKLHDNSSSTPHTNLENCLETDSLTGLEKDSSTGLEKDSSTGLEKDSSAGSETDSSNGFESDDSYNILGASFSSIVSKDRKFCFEKVHDGSESTSNSDPLWKIFVEELEAAKQDEVLRGFLNLDDKKTAKDNTDVVNSGSECHAISRELRKEERTDKGEAIESKKTFTDKQMEQDDEDESEKQDFEMEEQDGEKERKNNAVVQELYYTDEWEKLHDNSSSTPHTNLECHAISRELRKEERTDKGEAIESKKTFTDNQMEQDDEDESEKQDFEMEEQDGEKERKNNAVVQERYYTDEWEKLHDNSSSTPHTNLENCLETDSLTGLEKDSSTGLEKDSSTGLKKDSSAGSETDSSNGFESDDSYNILGASFSSIVSKDRKCCFEKVHDGSESTSNSDPLWKIFVEELEAAKQDEVLRGFLNLDDKKTAKDNSDVANRGSGR